MTIGKCLGTFDYRHMDTNKKDILKALEKHKGIVTIACESIGLARSTYYKWLSEDDDFKKDVLEIQEVAIDFVESKLMEKINGITMGDVNSKGESVIYEQAPSDTAIIFFLKTKGRHRGYNERILYGSDPDNPLPDVTIFQLPDNGRD